ncbi:hypothetical protein RvY_15861 [Ramazzottius varieornatus]|uniref:Nuclear speckle splicing regulatory protein 1 N-terminal domain-containing protein n=1 Tax=Ramazzottius varieornatus TaxID=947166 RepID=A0A1D1VWF0_RAMVA|nr:hypothetical protein RvY_15861 [Ramazzottius varieornatus]
MDTPGALTGDLNKKYGLILRKKPDSSISRSTVRPNSALFEDDGGDVPTSKSIGDAIKREGNKALWKKETQSRIQQALEDDPTVFDYDGIYDEMTKKKTAENDSVKEKEKGKERKPKYMRALLAARDEREKEQDRRLERKVQREREQEGGQFADKEAFVTSAYKKKMQELQEQERREKEMDKIEAQLDVTKQKDMGGFYRHLLKQTTGEEKVQNAGERSMSSVPSLSGSVREASSDGKRKDEPSEEADKTKRPRPEIRSEEVKPEEGMEVEDPSSSPCLRTPLSSPARVSASEAEVAGVAVDIPKRPGRDDVPDMKRILAKRATEDTTMSAKERYLARQAAKKASAAIKSDP